MPCNSFDGRTVYAIGDEPPAMHHHAPLEVLEVAWRGRRNVQTVSFRRQSGIAHKADFLSGKGA